MVVGGRNIFIRKLRTMSSVCTDAEMVDDFGAELAGGQHEDRLKAEVIEIGLKKRSACVFEARASAQAADGAANIGTRSVTCACWPSG